MAKVYEFHMKTFILVFLLIPGLLHAGLRLPNIFGDHMVLQRGKPVTVWGSADAGEAVEVRFAGQAKTTRADAKGTWTLHLEPLEANAVGQILFVKASSGEQTFSDVLIGDVWLCGGQSNMEWTLRACRDADIEIPAARLPGIRFIRIPKLARMSPQDDFPVKSPTDGEGNWRLAIPEQVENCTGVGYFFAKRLHRNLKIPIGLVDTSWGGTMAQHWATKESLRPIPEMKPYFEKFETALKEWNEGGGVDGAKKRLETDLKDFEVARADAIAKGEREPRKPNPRSYTDPADKGQPGGMINGVLYPVARYRYKGILFYQGENNSFAESWKPFYATFPAVIDDWRNVLQDDLPFCIIQIAGWSNRRSMSYDMNHHCNVIREIQHLTWERTENTGLIVTYDTNSNGSIHPGRKTPVGERAARWALAEVYGHEGHGTRKPLEWRGPVYAAHEVKDGKVYISFHEKTHRGLRLDQDVEVGFYIAGDDREFHHARARINKDTLIVWHDEVKEPRAVRYAWSNLPMGGLMNARELPAYPFRTDTWPITPHQSTGDYEVEKILKPSS